MNKKELPIFENGGSGINLRGLVAGFAAEQLSDLFNRHVGFERHHLRRNLPEPFVTLKVEFVLSVG